MDGASGSAIKGIKFLPSSTARVVGSVGYDQRLSLWTVSRPAVSVRDASVEIDSDADAETTIVAVERSVGDGKGGEVLKWLAGQLVNVGDVCALSVGRGDGTAEGGVPLVVTGEGFQMFRFPSIH